MIPRQKYNGRPEGDLFSMNYKISEEERKFLEQYDITQFEQPSLTVDIAVFAVRKTEDIEIDFRKDAPLELSLLMVQRGTYPYRNLWALPGGFILPGEKVEESAVRELRDETSVENAYLRPFGTYSDAGRDPRGWIISNGFLALVDAKDYHVRGGSDAWAAEWFRIEVTCSEEHKTISGQDISMLRVYQLKLENPRVPASLTAQIEQEKKFVRNHGSVNYNVISEEGFAFDHARIILDAFLELQRQTQQDGRIVFDLMPDTFTLFRLQEVQEIILGRKLLTPNFRRKIQPLVIETEQTETGAGHRPARLYRRNPEAFLI